MNMKCIIKKIQCKSIKKIIYKNMNQNSNDQAVIIIAFQIFSPSINGRQIYPMLMSGTCQWPMNPLWKAFINSNSSSDICIALQRKSSRKVSINTFIKFRREMPLISLRSMGAVAKGPLDMEEKGNSVHCPETDSI